MLDGDVSTYTLAGLSAEVGRRVADAGLAPVSGRVSPVPDGRTLRYYTTLGLLDRPVEVRDRQARYGERHVLQALAVKALQATGQSLGLIQAALAGLSNDELASVASGVSGQSSECQRRRFWTTDNADAGRGSGSSGESPAPEPEAVGRSTSTAGAAGRFEDAVVQTSLPLTPGVSVVLDGVWTPESVGAVRAALEPCLDALLNLIRRTHPDPCGSELEERA